MYLSAHKVNLLARTMAVLAEPQHGPALRLRVGALMLELLDAQHYASYVWDPARSCFDQGVHLNMDSGNLRQYEAYYQYNLSRVTLARISGDVRLVLNEQAN